MLPVPGFVEPAECFPLKLATENKYANNLKIISEEDAWITSKRKTPLKPQQSLAAVVFRLFGFDNIPVYYADTAFLKRADSIEVNSYLAKLLRDLKLYSEVVDAGLIYKNNVAEYKSDLIAALEDKDVLCFSKKTGAREIVVAYNTSETEAKERFILLNSSDNGAISQLRVIYGYDLHSNVHLFHSRLNANISNIKIYLKPLQLVILRNF